jgi:hypothetical protein
MSSFAFGDSCAALSGRRQKRKLRQNNIRIYVCICGNAVAAFLLSQRRPAASK